LLDDYVDTQAPFDHITAAMSDPTLAEVVTELFKGVLPEGVLKDLGKVVSASKAEAERDAVKNPPGVTSSEGSTLVGSSVLGGKENPSLVSKGASSAVAKARADAVQEAIAECEGEQEKTRAASAVAYRELMVTGQPSERVLKMRAEEFGNPDFWWVEAGNFSYSILGAKPEDFSHSAVYTAKPEPSSLAYVRPVFWEYYDGPSRGGDVSREYPVLADRSYSGWALVSDILVIYNGPELAASMRAALELKDAFGFSVTLNQAPPGAGKTTAIVAKANVGDVVACPVKESVRDTAAKLVEKNPGFASVVRVRVRTVDSYLVNCRTDRRARALTASRLLADEVFMTHAGRWYAMAALLGVSEVQTYGDMFQIPHVPRATVSSQHVRMVADVVEYSYMTYRCPGDAVAAWGHIYDWKVRTVSKIDKSMRRVQSTRGLTVPAGCTMMCMYQAGKKQLRTMYAGCGVPFKIVTVHESEGKTYDNVWLHRFDNRKRTDDFSLYDKIPYALVAMSRHRKSFLYVAPDLGDLVCKWMAQAQDPRRVAAAMDVNTVGQSVEKI